MSDFAKPTKSDERPWGAGDLSDKDQALLEAALENCDCKFDIYVLQSKCSLRVEPVVTLHDVKLVDPDDR